MRLRYANEYAAAAHAYGAPSEEFSAAHQSLARFRAALAKEGGRPRAGRNGPMIWSETRGWFERAAQPLPSIRARPVSSSSAGRTVRDLEAQQREVTREIRMSALRADEALVMGASALAWRWARLFASGGELRWGASADERTGWQLHRLGYVRPPVRVLERQLARSMR